MQGHVLLDNNARFVDEDKMLTVACVVHEIMTYNLKKSWPAIGWLCYMLKLQLGPMKRFVLLPICMQNNKIIIVGCDL